MPSYISGTFVDTPALGELNFYQDCLLVVDEAGNIAHFEPSSSPASVAQIALASQTGDPVSQIPEGSFLLPTFCDLHLHAPQFLYQGNGLDLPLLEWLDKYTYKAEERLDSDPVLAKRVYDRLARRLLENGTGAVSFFGTIKAQTNEILARSMLDAGIRARVGKLSMDISSRPTYVEASAEASLEAARGFALDSCALLAQQTGKSLIEPVLTPRFVPTCSDELLSGLADMSSKHSLHVQSHLAEAYDQVKWVEDTRGKDDIDVFDQARLLNPRTVQAHCTYLTPPDLQRIVDSGTSIAHCPLSNIYFSSEPFPLREALKMGVKIGLGTDVAGGYSLDMMNAMRNAVTVSRMRENRRLTEVRASSSSSTNEVVDEQASLAITWTDSLYLATRGGGIALGGSWKDLGHFKVGAPFDAQQIKLVGEDREGVGALDFFDLASDISPAGLSLEMVEKWWCIGDNRNRMRVWIQGVQCFGV
ncbi:hypothetical protein DFP72DRAFT_892737 [Ephemerocybe angulata]|uniref:Amidohydrolase-related domain-containing protein n=1 Tax=Ephemerocybe angulata TaxID=980116 RepID=A0A8H6I109_9AGAR|nr:hypothetical protein DFP72DRAFT_892737 [Tulosesus angulatus]